MLWVLALIVVMSVVCNWAVWRMLLMADLAIHAPAVVADAPDYQLDWRGLI